MSPFKVWSLRLAFLLSIATGCFAQSSEADFVVSLMEAQQKTGFNFWDIPESGLPGGILVRGFFDVTGDGNQDLLICSSIDPELQWSLFVAHPGGFRLASSSIKLQGPSARLKRGEGLTLLSDITILPDWIGIVSNQIDSRGVARVSSETISGFFSVREIQSRPGWPASEFGDGIRFTPAETISLREFLEDPTSVWRPYSFEQSLHAQTELIPEQIMKRLKRNYFTPEEARRRLSGWGIKTAVLSSPGAPPPRSSGAVEGHPTEPPPSDTEPVLPKRAETLAELEAGEMGGHMWMTIALLLVASGLALVIKRAM